MSINQLISDTTKPWLNARVNNLQVDGVITVPTVSIGQEFMLNGATLGTRRCYVTRLGKLYTFVFHMKITAVVAGQDAVITFTPAGLAKIPGYLAANTDLEQTSPIFKLTPKPGAATTDLFGILANQNSNTFDIVAYGTNTPYQWQAGDAPADISCTIQVESQ